MQDHDPLFNAPRASADFFLGDVHAGLERIRLRLLDLTNRNRLLNFRHPKNSSLRVVDELPDQLFERLRDGGELVFRPVPRPPQQDPLIKEGQRVVHSPAAKEYAESLRIATSFDLPLPEATLEAKRPERHTDNEIQTLFYPEELERLLSKIASTARLAIEETGSNMLYLVFGFLGWYESDASQEARVAPLVLLPVSLRRGDPDLRTRAYRYYIQYSGEDIIANLSLQERMRRDFNIEIPDLTDDDTPDAYFARLQPALDSFPRWRIRRQITLTLLSFGKLLMYRDLAPQHWPNGSGPDTHPRIRDFFVGIQHEGIAFAPDYPIDDAALREQVPALIYDADSSQHSALVDALNGKNLVIEGPPGTGKSQTITNLIAAALVQGKTVLFVAEKLAALEVVRNRLDKAGLGLFCLELHSHRTQKKELLEDLTARIKQHHQWPDPQALNDRLQLLERDKQRLTEYAALMNSPYGQFGSTVYDLLWACQRRRRLLTDAVALIESLRLPTARDFSLADIEERRQLLHTFAEHLTTVFADFSTIAAHPWFGVTNTGLLFNDEQGLLDTLGAIARLAETLKQAIADLNATFSCSLQGDIDTLSTFLDSLDSVPFQEGVLLEDLLPLLADSALRRRLDDLGLDLQKYRQLLNTLETVLGRKELDLDQPHIDELQRIVAILPAVLPTARTIADVDCCAEVLEKVAGHITTVRTIYEEITQRLGYRPPFTRNNLALVNHVFTLLRDTPFAALHCRHIGLKRDDAGTIIQAAQSEVALIRTLGTQLSQHLHLDQAPPLAEVRRHVIACTQAGLLRVFKRNYRAARRAHAAMAHTADTPNKDQLRRDFRDLSEYLDRLERFTGNPLYQDIAGSHFGGIETPFEALARLVEWRRQLHQTLGLADEHGRILGEVLWNGTIEQLQALARSETSQATLLRAPTELDTALRDVIGLVSGSQLPATDDFVSLAQYLIGVAQRVRYYAATLRTAGLADSHTLSSLPYLLTQLAQAQKLGKTLATDPQLAATLGSAFAGPQTHYEHIAYTCRFHDAIVTSSLPKPVKQRLVAPGAAVQIAVLKTQSALLRTTLQQLNSAIATFSALAKLDQACWYGTIDEIAPRMFVNIAQRAQVARSASDNLSLWLDYQRARHAAAKVDLESLLRLAEERQLPLSDLEAAFDFVLFNSLTRDIFSRYPYLAEFSGLTHEQVRARFMQLDRETIDLYRKRAAHQISQRPIPAGNGIGPVARYTELALIRHEQTKQRRHIPIRQLVRRAGRALQALKPCFMMGPLSVAQYLPPGQLTFDYIIMDEASQLKPEDALGAIARAKQAIIVGDHMQLPPTSFFDRIGGEEDVDEEDLAQSLEESESILDIASRVYTPVRLLKWHYRSQHGSLIAFSNTEFYKGELIVFPSPLAISPDLGVKFVYVAEGIYENHINMIEATQVVEAVFEHMRTRSRESLGVVALNTWQRGVIEEEFERRLKDDPHAQRYVEHYTDSLEPFFIKNLENVQGDERDVIFISVTYGPPTPNGRPLQRFGPITTEMGHRRLNVLFTRAKRRVVVFSSMLTDAIQIRPDTKWGVRALKAYLAYAQSGILEQPRSTGRPPDSDFEVEVAHALKTEGFEVEPQVGVAGYFIDIAVKHPKKADAYILAVECDGATYHSARSARDRDRLRQEVLESLGWRVHRIWSADWFKHRSREIERVVTRLQEFLRQEELRESPLAHQSQSPSHRGSSKTKTDPSVDPPQSTPTAPHRRNASTGLPPIPGTTRLDRHLLVSRAREVIATRGKVSFTPGERAAIRGTLGPTTLNYSDYQLATTFLQTQIDPSPPLSRP